MLHRIETILVPILLASSSGPIVSEATWLARKFGANIILLHVAKNENDCANIGNGIRRTPPNKLDEMWWPDVDGIQVTRLVVTGHSAIAILEVADRYGADLIMMSVHDRWRAEIESGRYLSDHRFKLHSITADVVRGARCPVWIAASAEEAARREFSIRPMLCNIDLAAHDSSSVLASVNLAKILGAELLLTHIVNAYSGPARTQVAENWNAEFKDSAYRELSKLQVKCGTQVGIVIESGNDIESLNRVATRMDANLLVIGHLFADDEPDNNRKGYRIIRRSSVPVIVLPQRDRPSEGREIASVIANYGNPDTGNASPVKRAILLLLVVGLGLVLMKLAFYSAMHTTCDYAGIDSGAPKVCAENLLPK